MPNNASRMDGAIQADPEARHALILGQPPRVGPLKELGPEAKETVASLRKAIGLPPTDDVPEYVGTMLRHPALYRRHTELALQLFGGSIPVRERELAILRMSWLVQAPYEWGEHVAIIKRLANGTSEEIARLKEGSSAPGWTDHERAVLRGVEELLEDAFISDETWAVLARTWNEQQLIEFPLLVGQYKGVAYLQNSLRMRLIDGNPGLLAR